MPLGLVVANGVKSSAAKSSATPVPRIGDRHDDGVAILQSRRQLDDAAVAAVDAAHRIDAVAQQIQQDLLDLNRDRRSPVGRFAARSSAI